MRFCSRCGLAFSGLAEWLAGGRLPLQRREEPQAPAALSPRRKGIRRAGKLMFFSGVAFPIFLMFSIAADEGAFMVFPFLLFFVSLAMMLYARLFSDKHAPVINLPAQTPTLGSTSVRGSLPPGVTMPMPAAGRQHVRTNELAQPPSVTENTTKLLDNE
ncbi:MAG TPA: hypothetical protein VJ656_08375 [Pyrinomonadaceae bacterium]|nr:hypothetical protein [Pyrinomonadaceae bacterium]